MPRHPTEPNSVDPPTGLSSDPQTRDDRGPDGSWRWVIRLKSGLHRVDAQDVQFERLIIDAADNSFAVDFHERLTVVTGLGDLEREGLVNELIGALGPGRSGVHLEMRSDAGSRFALFRPAGSPHLVVQVDTAEDVSDRYRTGDGEIDLLARAGLDLREARRCMRVTPEDLHTAFENERFLQKLAHVDQGRLWELAEKVKDRELRLSERAEATGSIPADAGAIHRIEELHHGTEHARRHYEKVRSLSLWGSFSLIMCATPIVMAAGTTAGLPLILGAMIAAITSLWYYRQVTNAEQIETEALEQVGSETYLGFHLKRVNALLSSDQGRKQLMSAAEEHRAALAEWELIAGHIGVDWALDHEVRIRLAARTTGRTNQIGRVSRPVVENTERVVSEVSAALLAQLSEVKTMGPGGESFPALLDEPLSEVPADARAELLELIAEAGASQQIILMTDDEDVASWARLESMTGDLAIIDLQTPPERSPDSPLERRHVAA